MPRKSKLTKELITQISELLVEGNCVNWVCDYVGIGEKTFYLWLNEGEEALKEGKSNLKVQFLQSIKESKAKAQLDHVKNLKIASHTDPKWSAWFLERSDPKNWGQKTYSETKLEANLTHDITKMTDEELERRAKEILKRGSTDTE